MQKQSGAILAIDRWSKYVGLAYKNIDNDVIFPIGYLMNDNMIFFHIGDMLTRYRVRKIMIGRPAKQKDVQEKIIKFMQNLDFLIDKNEVELIKVEEDYSTVQSGEIVSNFKKNAASDTISAMIILERGNRSE